MNNAIGVVLLLAGCSLCAWGQGRDESLRSSRPVPYAGGGIRGALAPVAAGVLITGSEASEFMGPAGFDAAPARTRSLVPAIEILQPQPGPDRRVPTTFSLELRFRPQADSTMVPSTLKVFYGASRVDITSRIAGSAQFSAQGFTAPNLQVPPGKHLLVFQIEDDRQRVVEREFRFEAQ